MEYGNAKSHQIIRQNRLRCRPWDGYV